MLTKDVIVHLNLAVGLEITVETFDAVFGLDFVLVEVTDCTDVDFFLVVRTI